MGGVSGSVGAGMIASSFLFPRARLIFFDDVLFQAWLG